MTDLEQLLSDAAPRPHKGLDVDAAFRRGRRRRRNRRTVTATLTIAAVLAGALSLRALVTPSVELDYGPVLSQPAPAPEAPVDGLPTVLTRPLAPDDGLPSWVRELPLADSLADPADARLAAEHGGAAYYAARGIDDTICLVQAREKERTAEGACVTPRMFEARGHLPLELFTDRETTYVALVPDPAGVAENLVVSAPVSRDLHTIDQAGPAGGITLPLWVDPDRERSDWLSQPLFGDRPLRPYDGIEDHSAFASAPSPELCRALQLSPARAEVEFAERGYRVEWRYSARGYTATRSSPPIGVLTDAVLLAQGDAAGQRGLDEWGMTPEDHHRLVVFVSPPGEAPSACF